MMETFYYGEIKLNVEKGVYYPKEDSLLILNYLKYLDLEGKKILDLGTGSGILAIYCSKRGAEVVASDINEKSLKCAKRNARDNKVIIKFVKSDLFDRIKEKFDIILFNPPYIPVDRELNSEEELSWSCGENKELLLRFFNSCKSFLKDKGFCLVVISSLTGLDLNELGHKYAIVREEKIPWENLYLVKLLGEGK